MFNLKSIFYYIILLTNIAYANNPCILENTLRYDSCKKELEIFIDINNQYKTNKEKPSYDNFTHVKRQIKNHKIISSRIPKIKLHLTVTDKFKYYKLLEMKLDGLRVNELILGTLKA